MMRPPSAAESKGQQSGQKKIILQMTAFDFLRSEVPQIKNKIKKKDRKSNK